MERRRLRSQKRTVLRRKNPANSPRKNRTAAKTLENNMKIVILDGHTLNPGDLSFEPLKEMGSVTCYDRTPSQLTAERIGDAEIVFYQ